MDLVVAQGLNRIQTGRSRGRIAARDQADDEGKANRAGDEPERQREQIAGRPTLALYLREVVAEHTKRRFGRAVETGNEIEERRLARRRWPQQADELALVDRDRHGVQRANGRLAHPIVFLQVTSLEECRHRFSRGASLSMLRPSSDRKDPPALLLTRAAGALQVGIRPTDLSTHVITGLIWIAVALVACYVPATRAARVDPMVALRYE